MMNFWSSESRAKLVCAMPNRDISRLSQHWDLGHGWSGDL